MSEDEGVTIQLDKPQRGAKDGYLQLFFNSRVQLGNLISEVGADTDGRIITFTQFMISSITDDDIRQKLEKVYDEKIIEINSSGYDNKKKHEELMKESMKIMGEITAFFDEFMGVTHRIKVGVA